MTKPHYRRTADGAIYQMADGYRNMVANLGTERDKAAWGGYAIRVLDPASLVSAYRSAWLPRKIVDIPALDATRKWRAWQAEAAQITAIEAEEKRLNLREKVKEALTVARLFGGSVIYMSAGEGDVSQPLDPASVGRGGIRHLTVLSPQQITPGEVERDPDSTQFGMPSHYRLGSLEVHPSRLTVFSGAYVPDAWQYGRGWGDSVLQSTMDAIQQADATAANIASLVFEAKIDVIHIPRLMEIVRDQNGEADVATRLMLGARAKGINGTLILDGGADGEGGEKYDQKSANFSTLPELLLTFFQQVSGAADIPMTRLFGRSAAGLSATGDGDERTYYDSIQALQDLELQPAMAMLDECILRSALGSRPDDVFYRWNPLRQVSETERANIFKTTADAARALAGSAAGPILPVEALSDSLVNELVEQGVLPGLEGKIEEYGSLAEQEPSEPEIIAAIGEPEGV
ncbi:MULTISPECIES: DUF1073 domain-containing protein [unclassified Haematobacter]|uniref:DUF1073 domain-containing protein n=1 Tax=unclassified Haematobacter TaxID=2640585 RepID=UPI0025B8DA0D|nr:MULTISPECIES: anti-CBASS Acb1 family protein [unclassified Haematobacter]